MAANPLIAFRVSSEIEAGLHSLAQQRNLSDSAFLQRLVELLRWYSARTSGLWFRTGVTVCRRAPRFCGEEAIAFAASDRAKRNRRFREPGWQRRGIEGSRGIKPVSKVSNLLMILINMAGFDPAIRRFEFFHPSQMCRSEHCAALPP